MDHSCLMLPALHGIMFYSGSRRYATNYMYWYILLLLITCCGPMTHPPVCHTATSTSIYRYVPSTGKCSTPMLSLCTDLYDIQCLCRVSIESSRPRARLIAALKAGIQCYKDILAVSQESNWWKCQHAFLVAGDASEYAYAACTTGGEFACPMVVSFTEEELALMSSNQFFQLSQGDPLHPPPSIGHARGGPTQHSAQASQI